MVIQRNFWLKRIKEAWKKVPIVWLAGVRRVGKTVLAKEIENALYFNCDLFSIEELLQNSELVYQSTSQPIIIFDEIHQLKDPSRVLKIGADAYPHLRILATGSSTLAATEKFSDMLTGRKRMIHLVPVLPTELKDFGIIDIKERLIKGGLPPALLSSSINNEFYAEWLDSFYAKDVQELFKVEKRHGFLRLLQYVIRENGGLLEINNLAKYAELSAPTVRNYLQVLETTTAVYCLRPFHNGGKKELIKQPKYYAFDTGFVAYCNGWTSLRSSDCGLLLENLVLETLQALPFIDKIHFWRSIDKIEIDFVCPHRNGNIDTIECKWNGDAFDPKAIKVFRQSYPKGNNYVVSHQVLPHLRKIFGDIEVDFVSIYGLADILEKNYLLNLNSTTSPS